MQHYLPFILDVQAGQAMSKKIIPNEVDSSANSALQIVIG